MVGHAGDHEARPRAAWDFLNDKDRKKIEKAGYATPRGGHQNAYQNHVYRNNKVIIPYERIDTVDLSQYRDGYIIRLLPEQYFSTKHSPRPEFLSTESRVVVGENAFLLYRSEEGFTKLPPMEKWKPRALLKEGKPVMRRSRTTAEEGHYVKRLSRVAGEAAVQEGPPQGIFAPEYADSETNFLSQCVLAWLIVQTKGSPYLLTQAGHLRAILQTASLSDAAHYERRSIIRHGLTCCPLCMRFVQYHELHEMINFESEVGLSNAGIQVEGATRSTVVNLFHLDPLVYENLEHIPQNVAWGHAICNTRLGQRKCYSLNELMEMDLKVAVILEEGLETFGWISRDYEMIRSANGSVWIRLNGDVAEGPPSEDVLSEETSVLSSGLSDK